MAEMNFQGMALQHTAEEKQSVASEQNFGSFLQNVLCAWVC